MGKVGIIGGGPAGLASAQALSSAGIPFTLFECGAPLLERNHERAEDLGLGIGGAGLFSDGKFSFYPSGTHLYRLEPTQLASSYELIKASLNDAGIDCADFPDLEESGSSATGRDFEVKNYRSSYGTLDQRKQLTKALASFSGSGSIRCHAQVVRIERAAGGYEVIVRDMLTGRSAAYSFDSLVLATGRFGGLDLADMSGDAFELSELRYEVGIRIEHPNHVGFLRQSKNPDVKFVLHESEIEARTFCTCRGGEVWMIPYGGISALSGRSDGPPTGYSNFGLLPRFSDASCAQGRAVWNHFMEEAAGSASALWQPLTEFMGSGEAHPTTLAERPWHPRERFARGDIAGSLPTDLYDIIRGSIQAILARFPDMDSPETVCLFPAIEGVGLYPRTDAEMRLGKENVWCCGDVVGRFRGLVPALVSGHYAGAALAAARAKEAAEQLATEQAAA